MKLKDLLRIIQKGTHISIFTSRYNTVIFTGLIDLISHTITQTTLSLYLDSDIREMVKLEDRITIYCD